MWAKDKICFQHLVLNEMRQNTNTDRWVAGMVGTETEVARTIEAWMQRRGGIEHDHGRKRGILCTKRVPKEVWEWPPARKANAHCASPTPSGLFSPKSGWLPWAVIIANRGDRWLPRTNTQAPLGCRSYPEHNPNRREQKETPMARWGGSEARGTCTTC
jgi:hypothetical protein